MERRQFLSRAFGSLLAIAVPVTLEAGQSKSLFPRGLTRAIVHVDEAAFYKDEPVREYFNNWVASLDADGFPIVSVDGKEYHLLGIKEIGH